MLHFDIILSPFKETIQIFSKIPTFPQNSYLFPTKIEEKADIPTASTFSDQCGHPAEARAQGVLIMTVFCVKSLCFPKIRNNPR